MVLLWCGVVCKLTWLRRSWPSSSLAELRTMFCFLCIGCRYFLAGGCVPLLFFSLPHFTTPNRQYTIRVRNVCKEILWGSFVRDQLLQIHITKLHHVSWHKCWNLFVMISDILFSKVSCQSLQYLRRRYPWYLFNVKKYHSNYFLMIVCSSDDSLDDRQEKNTTLFHTIILTFFFIIYGPSCTGGKQKIKHAGWFWQFSHFKMTGR